MQLENIVGILAGVFTTIAVLPQIIKALKTKKVKDVSAFMFIIMCLGVGFWTVYGIFKNDWPIIITNGISFVFNLIMLIICLKSQSES